MAPQAITGPGFCKHVSSLSLCPGPSHQETWGLIQIGLLLLNTGLSALRIICGARKEKSPRSLPGLPPPVHVGERS